MKYKGYTIGKRSRNRYDGNEGDFCWNACKDGKNISFDTLREAKQYIDSKTLLQ